MCGIAGFCRLEEVSEDEKVVIGAIAEKLFIETKDRGTDAAGFTYVNNHKELVTVKGPVTSESLVKDPKWDKFKKNLPRVAIMHTRSMTLGSPADNFNNHPLIVDKELSVVHNGVIRNHAELKRKYDVKPKGEVDSEIIPLLMNNFMKSLSKTQNKPISIKTVAKAISATSGEIEGGYACAALSSHTPYTLYLFRHANPIIIVYSETLKTIFFASESGFIESAFCVDENMKKGSFGLFKQHHYDHKELLEDTMVAITHSISESENVVVNGVNMQNIIQKDPVFNGYDINIKKSFSSKSGRFDDVKKIWVFDEEIPQDGNVILKSRQTIVPIGSTSSYSSRNEDWRGSNPCMV